MAAACMLNFLLGASSAFPDDEPAPKDAAADDTAKPPPKKPNGHGDLVSHASTEMSVYKDTDAVTVVTPTLAGRVENPLSEWSVGARWLVDVVSAASVDIVSTASRRWREVRNEGDFDASAKFGDVGISGSGSVSSEPDYFAWAAGGNVSIDLAQKNVTLLGGYTYGRDTIGRSGTPFDVFSRIVETHTVNAALTVVVNKDTLLGFIGDLAFQEGDSSKPYRYIPMFTRSVAAKIPAGASIDLVNKERIFERPLEQLPTSRDYGSLTVRLAKRFTTTTVRLSERLYRDTWGLSASTTDFKPIFDLGERVAFWPHARFHAQAPVAFWQRAYTAEFTPGGKWVLPRFRTGDRELGPLTGVTGGMGFQFKIGPNDAPADLSLTVEGETIWTKYLDDLYITDRVSALGVVGLEAVFE
ncbi:MAG TPA: DUF3570 domain-containing protein [Minicystis sp.]|nr:DUF3570 domain-containing protein [Minicystis sp.]